LGGVK